MSPASSVAFNNREIGIDLCDLGQDRVHLCLRECFEVLPAMVVPSSSRQIFCVPQFTRVVIPVSRPAWAP